MEDRPMTFLQHLEELRQRVFRILWVVLPLFLFYMTFTIRFEEFLGVPLPYPYPDFYNAISVMVVRGFMDSLLPAFVQRVQLNPWEAIVVQFKVALFLAVLTSMPWMVYQMAKFLAPGLYEREKRIIFRITVPGTLLFAGGVIVAYFVILPFAFEFLYGIGVRMGLAPLVGPEQFFDIVLLFFVGMGVAFQTPVIMWGLAALGIIAPDFWKRNWRYATIAFFIFGALITPDGSGITMMLVAVPMSFLYVAGYLISKRTWRKREGGEPPETRGRRSNFAVWSVVVVVVAALTGGLLYYNQGLFVPPTETTDTFLAAGNLTVQVPAYVLYSPAPFSPDITTGTRLKATDETTIGLRWSAASDTDMEVAFGVEGPSQSAIRFEDAPNELTVFPVLWKSPEVDFLELSATNGNSSVFTLGLDVDYRLLLRGEFSDSNRNALLDTGETVHREYYVISYVASPGTSEFSVELSESGIPPPIPDQLVPLRTGVFSSAGSGWSLETTVSELQDLNLTYSYTAIVEDPTLDEHGIRLFLTRSLRWTESEGTTTWVNGELSTQFTFTFSVDPRFGTVYTVLSQP